MKLHKTFASFVRARLPRGSKFTLSTADLNTLLSAVLQGAILHKFLHFDDLTVYFSGRAWPLGHALI